MIKYGLICNDDHEFEGWFQSSAAFDQLSERKLISCTVCGSPEVSKAIMAPSVATRSKDVSAAPTPRFSPSEMRALAKKIREEVRAKSEYVGPKFAEEARKIHNAESPERAIFGEASPDDVRALAEDGIPFFPLPPAPDELN